MPSIRDIRLATGHSQRSFAVVLDVPFETYPPLDSGRRPVPDAVLQAAERTLDQHRRLTELFALDALAGEFSIHHAHCEQRRATVTEVEKLCE